MAKIKVIVSIPPQEFFVRKIADTLVDISVLISVGQSPATYNPTPQQMINIENSDIFFTIGVPFEEHLLKKLNSNGFTTNIIKTQRGIDLIPITGESHGRDHGNLDPHIWLDPMLVKIQAENITNALIKLIPERKDIFRNNLNVFKDELDSINTLIHSIIPENNRIYVFHPSFGYFCKAYGLKQVAIEFNGKEPSAKQLTEFVKRAKKENINTIFVQPQFSKKAAKVIAESINGDVMILDPLSSDYYNNLIDMARKISASYQEH